MTFQIFSKSKTILFADDTTMYLTGPNPDQFTHNANKELKKLYEWCLSNRLTINTTKTYFMLFTIKQTLNLPHLHINDKTIFRTDKITFFWCYL